MDVDIHPSPSSVFRSFRQVSMTSAKRPRSPDAETAYPIDRPTKRLFVTTSGYSSGATDPTDRSPGGSSYGAPSAGTSRYPSEDWVKQAGGLSIDSPMFRQSVSANSSYEHLGASGDVDMAMDTEDSAVQSHANPLPVSTSTSSLSHSGASGLSHRSDIPSTPHKELPHALSKPHPQINVVPATPSLHHTQSSGMAQRSFSGSPEMTPMALSPAQTFNQLLSPSTPRRKVTMGPRADCEKCRMGVKGHWMHFD
ncbi:hypothetical protein CC1G_03895 [Coprinopsis cinerea okayama7|uniref:Uncharacterized protein n=1 Tax=Coprinopsis cinerea (strain Okayama-7 / 130 / ATCC MYA-4618 / FGSC 9003) TaxID=240176 RepID=A8NH46_COPC7|nr:hypothetical protein CC1G_03895 [Coprinopsis cinerea okayama7\|eukprot:XP_001833678.1 hypothetical protein CC1G_03895 [Coprinopsis cinerea okayama7\